MIETMSWMQPYRELGFTEPDYCGVTHMVWHGVDFTAHRVPNGVVAITATYVDGRDAGIDETACAATWDVAQVRNTLGQGLARLLPTEKFDAVRDDVELTIDDAENITAESLDAGTYHRFTAESLPRAALVGYALDESLDHRAALKCAVDSADAPLVGWLAADHPNADIRRAALQNPALPTVTMLALAGDATTAGALLQRPELPAEVFTTLFGAETARYVASERPRDHFSRLLDIALHRSCPEALVPGLVAHLIGGCGGTRAGVEREAWRASPERRDLVHTVLVRIGDERSPLREQCRNET